MLNKEFLKKLDKQENKIIFARITSLSMDDLPLETLEGKVTSGSISIDGESSVRRSCNLSMVVEPEVFTKYFWTLNTKFKLEIGLINFTDKRYPDIIWFNQGVYIINSFSAQVSATGYSISLSGQDKMCRLNGTIGGTLESAVNFSIIEQVDANGNVRYIHQTLKNIIIEALHHYGGEPFHNIIINDLDDTGLILQEYRYDIPLYLIRDAAPPSNEEYYQGTLDGKKICWYDDGKEELEETTLEELNSYDSLVDTIDSRDDAETVYFNFQDESWTENEKKLQGKKIAKIVYGETAGYMETDLTYNGELIAKAGDTIENAVLSKIKSMLGNYEYFYDVDGRFIFQKKKNFINTSWAPSSGDYIENLIEDTESMYTFAEKDMLISLSSAPTITNIRNDFSIWGETKQKTPIHLRYALHNKPTTYTTFEVYDKELQAYNSKHQLVAVGQESVVYTADKKIYEEIRSQNPNKKVFLCDWREVLYRMALDYSRFNHFDDYALRLKKFNPIYSNGTTTYEYFYPDILSFWQELYNMNQEPIYAVEHSLEDGGKYYILKDRDTTRNKMDVEYYSIDYIYSDDEITTILQGLSKGIKVYQRLEDDTYKRVAYPFEENAELYVYAPNYVETTYNEEDYEKNEDTGEIPKKPLFFIIEESEFYPEGHTHQYWHKNVYEAPSSLIFWFDFLEGIDEYKIATIGHRPKSDSEGKVQALYYPDTPNIIFRTSTSEGEIMKTGYRYFNITQQDLERMFVTSGQGLSAKERLDQLLYNHINATESLNITSLPVFWLEPNHRITVTDSETGINGDFIVTRLNFQISYNTTMTLTTTKAIDYII